MTNISVHTIVDVKSEDYFAYFKDNFTKLCKQPQRLMFYVHAISGLRYTTDSLNVRVISCQSGKGSTGHSIGLHSAVNNFNTTDINVVADVDVAYLVKDWDTYVDDLLVKHGFVGTTYEQINGFCSGNSKIQTYKDRPCMTWCAISPEASTTFKQSKTLDLMPHKQSTLKIDTQELSETFGLPVGYELLRDAAWQLPAFIRENKIPYKTLFHARPTIEAKVLKTGNNYNEEYQLDGVPFVAHQRGSMKHPFRGITDGGLDISRKFYDIIDAHVSALLARK